MLCEENSMENFIENLHDLVILIDSMSPTIVNFFENSFNQTRFTRRIDNLYWKQSKGSNTRVIGKPDSIMTQKYANFALNKKKHFDDSDKAIQKRLVATKMLQIGWVYENPEGKEPVDFRELIVALSEAKHESLFSTDFVKIMCNFSLERYRREIILKVALPWLLYFILIILYMSEFAVKGASNL